MASTTVTTTTTNTNNNNAAAAGAAAATTAATGSSSSSSSTTSRAVHPCVVSLATAARGVEFSTWARLLWCEDHDTGTAHEQASLPWLVTAAASTIRIYRLVADNNSNNSNSQRLQLYDSIQVAGAVCFLETLHSPPSGGVGVGGGGATSHGSGSRAAARDNLIVGWTDGRISVVEYNAQEHALRANGLLDLTPWVSSTSTASGSCTSTAVDAQFAVTQSSPKQATLAAVLEGGSVVITAALQYQHNNNYSRMWTIHPVPYVLPLAQLATNFPTYVPSVAVAVVEENTSATITTTITTTTTNAATSTTAHTNTTASGTTNAATVQLLPIATGWGDIIDTTFLAGDRIDAQLVVLHAPPAGRIPSHRLARQGGVPPSPPVYVTVLAVHPTQTRAAWLWSTAVPVDAIQVVTNTNATTNNKINNNNNNDTNLTVVVVCVNSILILNAQGMVVQHTAVNGWAHTTCPAAVPRPVANLAVPTSIALDGSTWTWWTSSSFHNNNNNNKLECALIVLRTGHVYVWQPIPSADQYQDPDKKKDTTMSSSPPVMWTLLPTGHYLDGMGQVAHASKAVWNMAATASTTTTTTTKDDNSKVDSLSTQKSASDTASGVWLVGSRLGDSHLVEIRGQTVTLSSSSPSPSPVTVPLKPLIASIVKQEQQGAIVKTETAPVKIKQEEQETALVQEDPYELQLRQEEEALYSVVVPHSDEEGPVDSNKRSKQSESLHPWLLLQSLKIVDTLMHLGPIGPATEGPIAATPAFLEQATPDHLVDPAQTTLPTAATAHIVPVGFGSSGGLAWATLPGRDDRFICAEQDLLHVQALFGAPSLGLVFMAMDTAQEDAASIRVLKVVGEELSEVHVDSWAPSACTDVFQHCQLLQSQELTADTFCLLTHHHATNVYAYYIFRQNSASAKVELVHQGSLTAHGALRRVTGLVASGEQKVMGLVWSEGCTTLLTIDPRRGIVASIIVESTPEEAEAMLIDDGIQDEDAEAQALRQFYAQTNIVAADVFEAPRNLFDTPTINVVQSSVSSAGSASPQHGHLSSDFDEDDLELYGMLPRGKVSSTNSTFPLPNSSDDTPPASFLAICRQSGAMEVYLVTDKGNASTCVWTCKGAAQGFQTLNNSLSSDRTARSHMVSVREMKFFWCGPSIAGKGATAVDTTLRTFCLAVETSSNDVHLYSITKTPLDGVAFVRQPFSSVSRTSLEQSRHRTKLSRKGIIAKTDTTSHAPVFEYSTLLPFEHLSGQDGLMAMTPRPFWIIAERGCPSMIHHRVRHSAPAGGKPKVLNGFCTVGRGHFLTLHERVGRVGSQRLTLFNGLSKVFQSQGVLSGEGLPFERKMLGVTVRRIEFIDDPSISTCDHPLYAMLVSREMEVDQSELNDDGLTPEEREQAKKDKEDEKIKRQVEADLGGFDFEHEWVEEIVREDAFHVDQNLGGAPPVFKEAYSLWIVDSAEKWQVVDSFDLEEYEHGMTLKVMSLSNFKEEPGSNNDLDEDGAPEDLDQTLFVMVGTGTVDHNGEDVTGKGRALLFQITRKSGGRIASLTLAYEKEIFHGPVTTLTCLSVEGKNRLMLGAGSDVNVEQWGNGKLTQVGFFRATMQISDIRIFKNFLLLSDAYDSLHLLVYRESDKSLTLLAKEYEPVAVYAAGLLSRGPSVTFLCHDDRQNVQFLQYAPGEAAARGGNKLVCRADFHLGTQTIHFGNHMFRNSLLVHSATPTSTLAALQQQDSYFGRADDDQRISVHFGTTDGTVGAVVPLSEPVFWRLAALQSVLANAVEPDCGLSPRAWRLYRRCARRGGCRSGDRKKSVIDGDLIRRYSDLPMRDQEDLASAVGSTVDVILDNLLELQCGSLIL
eukprot:scaffold5020_cov179-Amphora_coffeaeformis.AAC.2